MGSTKTIICSNCKIEFEKEIKFINLSKKRGDSNNFCSNKCLGYFNQKEKKEILCSNCNKKFKITFNQFKKSKNHFCSCSCSVTYNNKNKKQGYRRSKLEVWLESKLTEKYPTLEIHFNRKDAIQSELDIYIPSLSLAFELSGIFHYEPIYGQERLNSIKNNDRRKIQACLENTINLHIIDTSKFMKFKESKANVFLDLICLIIDNNFSPS